MDCELKNGKSILLEVKYFILATKISVGYDIVWVSGVLVTMVTGCNEERCNVTRPEGDVVNMWEARVGGVSPRSRAEFPHILGIVVIVPGCGGASNMTKAFSYQEI